MKYYHGTSTAIKLNIGDMILPPLITSNLREEWRKKLTNKVFFTDSLHSAERYAKKAADKYGGEPVVYIVKPIGDIWCPNNTEYVADKAKILAVVLKE